MARIGDIALKKGYGQHFLRNTMITEHMINAVVLDAQSSIFEVGCGDGFLTRAILLHPLARLWTFEIDHQWATYIQQNIFDPRLRVIEDNFLDIDFALFDPYKPWTVLANLPYQITFPILHLFVQHHNLLAEGVIMVQEEVAQKITKTSGRGYGFISLYLQYYFSWKLLDKVAPTSFFPPPKVYSRLLYFKPRTDLHDIPDAEEFWDFVKRCFRQPRRTLKNNLAQSHFDISRIDEETLALRAQQIGMQELLNLWSVIR